MQDDDQRLAHAVEHTVVVRQPQQTLATFGSTSVHYHLVTVPSYKDLAPQPGRSAEDDESVVREGIVHSARPQVVTPNYLLRHEGFGDHIEEYLRHLAQRYGADSPGLLYTYRNERMQTNIVSGAPEAVADRIGRRLDRDGRKLDAVVLGVDDLWDVSLMKFIYDFTTTSLESNVRELRSRGMLENDDGVPRQARQRIEQLFSEAERGDADPAEVHRELERWELFDEYQDRFLALFKRR